jgi:hypothetical protein
MGVRGSIVVASVASFAIATLVSIASARAQTPAPDPTARHHDGFYLRMGLGPGFLHDSLSLTSSDATGKEASFDGSVKGSGVAIEIAFGGTVAPGVIVGGGLFHVIAFSRSIDTPGVDTQAKSTYGHFLVSPVIDVYPDPSGGFHFEGGAGIAISNNVNVSTDVSMSSAPIGFGAFAGVGYESWVADQWALGALLRLSVLRVREKQDDLSPFFPLLSTSQWTITHTGVDVALLATATFN